MRSPRLVYSSPQYEAINKVRCLLEAVPCVSTQGNREHAVQFLEGLLLGLGHKEEHEEEADDVPGRVPRECALGLESLLHRGPGNREDEVEEPGRCGGEGHANGPDV